MDKTTAAELVRGWRAERVLVNGELRAIQAKASGLDKLIEGIEVMFPDLASDYENLDGDVTTGSPPREDAHPRRDGPKATEGVRILLQSNPQQWFSGRDMMNAFEERGFVATETAIRLALKRARDSGFADVEQGERGQLFRFHSGADHLSDAGVSTS